jgi:hypothetical protein
MAKHDPFEFNAADARATFNDLPNKAVMSKAVAEKVTFTTSPGHNCMTVKFGGVEVTIAVQDPTPGDRYPSSEVLISVEVPGEFDPKVFQPDEKFGTVTLAVAKARKVFDYSDLHPFNQYA